MILDPPWSDEYRRLKRLRDEQREYTPKEPEPPIGHVLASTVAQWCLPGETPAQCIARRRAEVEATLHVPVLLRPQNQYANTRIGDSSPWDEE